MRSRTIGFRVLPSAVVAVALMSALGGCSNSGPATDGPLSLHDSIPLGSNCAPGGHSWAFGFQQFANSGHTTVVLDRVVLLRPRNERLVGSFAVPGDRVLGVARWPVTYHPAQPNWKNRQPVHGFRLAPGKAFNMILGIEAVTGSQRAASKGMLVYYHDSSGNYVATGKSANIIAAIKRKC